MRSLITGEDLKKKSLCSSCGLHKGCKSPYMSYTGKGGKGVLLYGEAPGKNEDENWEEVGYSEPTQFIGDAGQLLEEVLADNGIDIREDCWCINAINCRPPGNRTPTVKEISCCKPRVDKVIEELKPKFIFLLGGTAVESFYHGRFTNKSISNWRKLCIPDKGVNVWVIPLYHPSYILRNKGNLNLESTFKQDFKWAASCIKSMGQPFFVPFEDRVVILKDYKETIKVLKYILDEVKLISYDYETTGLKPYGSEQKIWCVSICDGDKSYSLPVSYPWWETEQEEKVKQYLRRILSRGSIKKVGHKLGFEDLWSRVKLAADTKGNYWCTKVFAHILDSRPDSSFFTGLKFQSYIHFGVDDYETEVEDYIVPKKGSKVNRLDEVDIDKLLLYCGGDSWYTFKHYERQKTVFSKNKGLTQAKDLFLDGLLALTDAQINGIPIDEIYFLEEEQTLQDKIDSLEYKLLNGREAKKYKEVTGKKLTILNKDFSAGDLRILFFDVLGLTAGKKTKKAGLDSVDAEVLLNLKHLFAKRIVERRKAHKLKNTYIAQFKRELYNGKVHPFGELHTASSFRSCIAKGSKVLAVRDFINYPNGVPIENIKTGDFVYCFDNDLNPAIRKVLWSGKTGHKKVVRVHWYAVGKGKSYLDVTPDHKIRHVSGKYIEAKNLIGDYRRKGDSKKSPKIRLLACRRGGDSLYFTGHLGKNNSGILEHRFIFANLVDSSLKNEELVHHKDENHFNHEPINLEKQSSGEHAFYHCKLNEPESVRKRIENTKKGWKDGRFANSVKRGKDHPCYLGLSKLQCYRLLSLSAGKLKFITCDSGTFKKYLNLYNIDINNIKLRYDKNGKYISKGRLLELSKLGISKVQKKLGHNYYKLEKLYDFYEISFDRRWGNQFGSFILGNHCVTKIEYLEEEVDVYNLEVEEFHNFIVNEICVKNSMSRPSFQNIPTRDEESKAAIRRGVIPSSGNKIKCDDYDGAEVRIAACETKDPVLVDYIKTGFDMHNEQAKNIFALTDKQVTYDLRFYAKNQFVFPEFYGSYYAQCSRNLMENCFHLRTSEDVLITKHLKNVGVLGANKKYWGKDFEGHVKQVEKDFWGKFYAFREWQVKCQETYRKKGYIETLMGFRRGGFLSNNQVLNTPIQATAFHCLLWSFIRLNKIMQRRKYKSKLIAQIHDEIMTDLNPEEEGELSVLTRRVMCNDLANRFDWLIVPMKTETEITGVDESWYYIKEIK